MTVAVGRGMVEGGRHRRSGPRKEKQKPRGRFRNYPQRSLSETPKVGRLNLQGGSCREREN